MAETLGALSARRHPLRVPAAPKATGTEGENAARGQARRRVHTRRGRRRGEHVRKRSRSKSEDARKRTRRWAGVMSRSRLQHAGEGSRSWKLTDAAGEYRATSEFGLPRGLCSFQFTDLFVRKQTENRILHPKCSEDSSPEAERARSKEPQRKGSKNKGIL